MQTKRIVQSMTNTDKHIPPSRTPQRERTLRNLTIVLSLLFIFALAEVGLRLVAHFTSYLPKTELYISDHYYLGKMLVPGASHETRLASMHVNSRAFRGKEFTVPKPTGTYRIFALGGSTTYGYYPATSSDDTAYPAVLETLLNAAKSNPSISRYEVVNAGLPGYSVRTSTQNFLSRILFYEPDMVIVYHNTNDLARYGNEENLLYPLQNQYVPHGIAAGILDHLLGWSFAAQELRFTLTNRLGLGSSHGTAPSAPSSDWRLDSRYPEVFRRDLRNLVILAKANGVVPVLASQSIAFTEKTDFARLTDDEIKMRFDQPAIFYARVPPRQRYPLFRLYNDIIRQVAEEQGIPFADVDSVIPKTPEYHWDYCHLTDKGSRLQAQAIERALRGYFADRTGKPRQETRAGSTIAGQ